jgi:catechol 2,3-dioxygenase-like lactoylglutathione lyase family enzyme
MPSKGFAGYDHIDARVRDLARARRFYDALMPELGLIEIKTFEGGTEYYEPHRAGSSRRFFGLHEDPLHAPNDSRICFAAETAAEVDRLAKVVERAGGDSIEGPEIPYSDERYYAVFFKDPSGNAFEIAYRRTPDDGAAVREDIGELIEAKGAFGA